MNHVIVDMNSSTGFLGDVGSLIGLSGLPAEWEEVLKTSDISKEEIVQNGTALVDVLRFHFNGVDNMFDSIPNNSLEKHGSTGIPALFWCHCRVSSPR